MFNNSLVENYRAFEPSQNWGYPPGVKMINYVSDDMRRFINPHWTTFEPISPIIRFFLGVVIFFILKFGFITNTVTMYMFTYKKQLRSSVNNYIIALCLTELGHMCTQMPLYVYNVFNGGVWQFGPLACQLSGFCSTFFSTAAIVLIAAMSLERYNTIVVGLKRPSSCSTIFAIFSCWGYAGLVSLSPFFGYGSYSPEASLETCAFDYLQGYHKMFQTLDYTIWIVFAKFFAPLLIITYCNFYMFLAFNKHENRLDDQTRQMNHSAVKCQSDVNENMRNDIRYARLVMCNFLAWTFISAPYIYVILQAALGDRKQVTPFVTLLTSLLAKCTGIVNPIILAWGDTKFRAELKKNMHPFCFPFFFITKAEKHYEEDFTIGSGIPIET